MLANGSSGRGFPSPTQRNRDKYWLILPSISTGSDFSFPTEKGVEIFKTSLLSRLEAELSERITSNDISSGNSYSGTQWEELDIGVICSLTASELSTHSNCCSSDSTVSSYTQFTLITGVSESVLSSCTPRADGLIRRADKFVVVNPCNYKFNSKGGYVNQRIFAAVGDSSLYIKKHSGIAHQYPTVFSVRLKSEHKLSLEQGCLGVIQTLGPNMNPSKPNYIDDLDKASGLLKQTYTQIVAEFISIVKDTTCVAGENRVLLHQPQGNTLPVITSSLGKRQASTAPSQTADGADQENSGERVVIVTSQSSPAVESRAAVSNKDAPVVSNTTVLIPEPAAAPVQQPAATGIVAGANTSYFKNILYGYLHVNPPTSGTSGAALASNVVYSTSFAVVVLDAFPKASFHLLILPKASFLSGVLEVRHLNSSHLSELYELHSLGQRVSEYLHLHRRTRIAAAATNKELKALQTDDTTSLVSFMRKSCISSEGATNTCNSTSTSCSTKTAIATKMGEREQQQTCGGDAIDTKWKVQLGFHATPSLHPLHLHVISNDFHTSPYLKTKKHWNSFTNSRFFVKIEEVERWLTEPHISAVSSTSSSTKSAVGGCSDNIRSVSGYLPNKEELASILAGPMRCPLCLCCPSGVLNRIPAMKTHLASCFMSTGNNN